MNSTKTQRILNGSKASYSYTCKETLTSPPKVPWPVLEVQVHRGATEARHGRRTGLPSVVGVSRPQFGGEEERLARYLWGC